MKKNIEILFTLFVGILVGIASYGSYISHNHQEPEPIIKTEYVYIETEPEIVTEYVYIETEPTFYRSFSDSEGWYLKDLGMREIEGGDVIDFLWVFYTAECRKEAFGIETYEEVWSSDAFAASWSRRGIEPNENCLKAFALFEEGWTPKPLWFRADHYHGFGTPLAQVGNHFYSTK